MPLGGGAGGDLNKRLLRSVSVAGKRVLIRCDFNVPQDKANPSKITNTARIEGALQSIRYCLESGAKAVVLCSHLGRPDGTRKPECSLAPVAAALEKLLARPVSFIGDCVGPEAEAACADPPQGTETSKRCGAELYLEGATQQAHQIVLREGVRDGRSRSPRARS